ncbi:hypothetical protein [Dyella japonica]|uniref:Uncharacterized protein n=1 Tax=Dyella japonica DSM 16301 TaxID=1440762 RepID=A0A0G9H1M3_9GAMM|nr:hypothetical protein [Dyella japonica]KLD63468.1 hypothetical protein Y882_11935 [Dyella japonica DSM 16301]
MQKRVRMALSFLAAIAIAAVSAAAGFYFGFYQGIDIGGKTMGDMAGIHEAHRALSEVDSSMAALGQSDLSLSQRQLALHMRTSLTQLGTLSRIGAYLQCSDKDRRALAAAANYVAAHPDPALIGPDPSVEKGVKFCESYQGGRGVTITYVATGQE